MGDNSNGELAVLARFRGREMAEFKAVKKQYGLSANSEVVRFLVRQEARRIAGQAGFLCDVVAGDRTNTEEE